MTDFQGEVSRLTESWSDAKAEFIMLMLTEELGELARALRNLGVQRWGHSTEAAGSASDVTDELGDMLFLLARIALVAGVDLGDAASSVLSKIRARVAQSD